MRSWAHITKGTRHILSIIKPIPGRDVGYGTPNGPHHTVGIRVEFARLFVFYVALICFAELLDISYHHRKKIKINKNKNTLISPFAVSLGVFLICLLAF